MSDRDALYNSILAHPGDDTPRLVYADWLEENGRSEEAEFIRIECQLEASEPDSTEYPDLLDQQEELRLWLTAHVPGPKLKLPAGLKVEGGANWWKYTLRGFPRFLEFEGYHYPGTKAMRALAAALPKAFAKLPTRWLVVQFITIEQLAELLKQPILAALDQLTVQLSATDDPQDEACELLARSSHLSNLHALNIAFPVGDSGAASLARSEHFPRLERLRLDQCMWLTPTGARLLGSADWFRGLQSLDLGELEATVFEELCRLDSLPNLHTLELAESSFPTAAWRAFARSKAFPRLTQLLNRTEMADGQTAALAAANGFRLTTLELGACAMGNDGAEALTRAPWLGSLRRLALAFNRIGSSGVATLAGSRKLTALKHLDLSYNTLGVSGLRAIAGNPALRGLTTLLLQGAEEHNRGLVPAHFHEFLSKLDMPRLRRLDLAIRPVGHRAARLLIGEKFGSLTRLDLTNCKLTAAAAKALLAAPTLQNLVELSLAGNDLKDGVKELTDPRTLPRLSVGNLLANRLNPDIALKLNRRPGITA